MAFYKDDDVARLKEQADIVRIIDSYLPLKKKGKNYLGLCPFHAEKTPSFTVSPDKQIFHCFGCGKGGDVFTFIMEREGVNFAEAIEMVAKTMGVSMETTNKDPQEDHKRKLFYQINREAARYFFSNLSKSSQAQSYLKNREISGKALRRYGLGYATGSWDDLMVFLKNKGYSQADIKAVDLIGLRKDGEGFYDRFRNRLIFPIINRFQQVVGFGGRVLDDSFPKYLNSSDTPVFQKGNNLYGLHVIAKESDRKKIILTEGYMDVISLYSHGIPYGVASLGTALTENQAKLLSRFGNEIFVIYDSDNAGINAARRAIDIFKVLNIPIKLIILPNRMDPDDYLRKKGKSAFESLLNERALKPVEFLISILLREFDKGDRVSLIQQVAGVISTLNSPVEREVYVNRYAKELSFSKEALASEVELRLNHGPINLMDLKSTEPKAKVASDERKIKEIAMLKGLLNSPSDLQLFKLSLNEDVLTTPELLNIAMKAFHDLEGNHYRLDVYFEELEKLCSNDAIDFTLLKSPVGEVELRDWIDNLKDDRLIEKRDKLVILINEWDKDSDHKKDGLKELLEELKTLNQVISIRKSDEI